MLLNNAIYPDFPPNLSMEIDITNYYKMNNFIHFIVNIYVNELNNEKYNIEFIGYYNENTKELKVSQKCRQIFVTDFVFNGKILVPNIFEKYILVNLIIN